jgi:DNA polymerase-1
MPQHDQLENTPVQNISLQEHEVHIRSKRKPGGNWNPDDPIGWTKGFGRRNPEYEKELLKRAHLKPGDEGYFDVNGLKLPGITIVRTKEEARIVMKKLMSPESEMAWHACDTEVMDIDLKNVGPVGNGYVTCLSMYSGPNFDYGLGEPPGTALWIDNLDDSFGVLQEFKDFFEDKRFKTVWHNYGFDRHVMWNEGIDVKGFGADTIHMARLLDTSRAAFGSGKGYSLEALTDDMLNRRKKPMKEIFGIPRLKKDGTPGSLIDLPKIEVMQRDPRFRAKWIVYSSYDAEGTYFLREVLQKKLEKKSWVSIRTICYIFVSFMQIFTDTF